MGSEYSREAFKVYHGLKRAVDNKDRPEEVKKLAEQILRDKEQFKKYVLQKIENKKADERKKVLENAKKNLTGWKKWFKMILPDSVILGQD